jgi:hypothetical protein
LFLVRRSPDVINVSVSVAAAVSAFLAAFAVSARAHVVRALLDGPVCGNPQQQTVATLLGHCVPCWGSGLVAGLLTLSAMMLLTGQLRQDALRRTP